MNDVLDPGPTALPSAVQTEGARLNERQSTVLALSLMFLFLVGALTLSLMPVVAPELRERFGLSASQIGLLTSVFLFSWGAGGIPAGLAVARWGGRVLGASCLMLVAGSLMFAVSSSFEWLLVGRAIQGLGGGMIVVVCSPILASSVPEHRLVRVWGIFGAGWGMGFMSALLIMPSIEEAAGFRVVFAVNAALALAAAAAVLAQRAARRRPSRSEAQSALNLALAFGSVVRNPMVICLALVNGAGLAISVGVLVWTPSYLQAHFGASLGLAAYLTAGLGAAQIVAAPASAVAAAKWGKLPVIWASITFLATRKRPANLHVLSSHAGF